MICDEYSADDPSEREHGLTNVSMGVQSGSSTLSTPATGDYAVHKNTYLGDADGNGVYSGSDQGLISRVIAGTDTTGGAVTGFDAHGWTDPLIVADTDGNGTLTSNDLTLLAQASVGLGVPQIPLVPTGITLVSNAGGGSVALDAAPRTAMTVVSNPPVSAPLVAAAAAVNPAPVPVTTPSTFVSATTLASALSPNPTVVTLSMAGQPGGLAGRGAACAQR